MSDKDKQENPMKYARANLEAVNVLAHSARRADNEALELAAFLDCMHPDMDEDRKASLINDVRKGGAS